MKKRLSQVTLVLGAAALAVLCAFLPWIYREIRGRILVARLERGLDPGAAEELATNPRGLAFGARRLLEPGDHVAHLARNWVELIRAGVQVPGGRAEAFDATWGFRLKAPVSGLMSLEGVPPLEEARLIHGRVFGSSFEVLEGGPWESTGVSAESSPQRLAVHLQYFLDGPPPNSHLVYLRLVRILEASRDVRLSGQEPGFELEMEDLTDVPDLLGLFLRPPGTATLPGGEPALELRLASHGTWRRFVPGMRLLERSVSYSVWLERSAAEGGPFLLGRIAADARGPLPTWYGEDAVLGAPLPGIERLPHQFSLHIPRSVAQLGPLQRFQLGFRPDPDFAARCGFTVQGTDSLPFLRTHRLPDAPAPGGLRE